MSEKITTGLSKVKIGDKKAVAKADAKSRRRLSVAASTATKSYALDGGGEAAKGQAEAKQEVTGSDTKACGKVVRHATLSKVGYVPNNKAKVNQDRACIQLPWGKDDSKSFWGVFDGHGSLGHDVSQYVTTNLHKKCDEYLKRMTTDKNLTVEDALSQAFVECNKELCKSSTDCTFSGTTVIVVYIDGDKMYSANAGDSRAVLAKRGPGKKKATAVDLSDDQKPERADEAKRIRDNGGRVAACQGMRGEDIGPKRVWLKHQDVPGLAMTRSFGDLVAASVGVIPKPEVWTRTMEPDDAFMILASDGVWEFIENQEAVDVVAKAKSPEEAVKALTDLATARWKAEEEVIDDITAVVAYFH